MKINKLLFMPALFVLSLTACNTSGARHPVSDYKAGELSVNANGGFKILQLCDIHLSNKDNQQLQFDFLDLTISEAKLKGANLIVLDGDTFTFADKATAGRLFDFINSYDIPWTFTFGNHDEQCYFSVTWLTSFLNSYGKNCVFKDVQGDDVNGNANFYIDINNSNSTTFERIFIFDSNRYYFSDYMGYDYIKQDQIDWYERVVEGTSAADSIAFFHIPLPEFSDAYAAYKSGDPNVEYMGGTMEEKDVSAPKFNSGLFNKMKELGSTKAVFCAHDHQNDFAIKYEGIILSYGTNSTDRIYSSSYMIGGQLISIDSSHNISLERIHHTYSELEER